jgi:ubiquinone/menaquinone biosynthesis C-methylase UbiE
MTGDPGAVFDRIAEDYDRIRPGYPATLVEAACTTAGLRPGSRVVEVGCGTGKLTVALAERGLCVEAIDPGPRLIGVAERQVRNLAVRFHVARFEDLALPDRAFDAVFSAAAFHWIDPSVGWAKAARVLRPGGVLALLSHVGGSNHELDEVFLSIWREVLPEAASWVSRDARNLWEGAEDRLGNVSELWAWLAKHELARPEAATLFENVELARVPIDAEETSEELLALLRTTSSYLRLDRDRRRLLERRLTAAIEDAGGTYRSTTFATLVTAQAAL